MEQLTNRSPSLSWKGEITNSASVTLIAPHFFNNPLKRGSLARLLKGISHSDAVSEVVLIETDGEGRSDDRFRKLTTGKRLIEQHCEPQNRAKARNVGADSATNEFLLFLDDDMLLRHWRWIDVVTSEMLSGNFEAAMFPRRHYALFPLLYDDTLLEEVVARWRSDDPSINEPFLDDPAQRSGNGNSSVYSENPSMFFCFPGCFTMIRKDAFQRLGGFPERFVGWGFEDAEFALNAIRQLTILNLFNKGEALLHIDHPVSPYKSLEYHENRTKFYSTHDAVAFQDFLARVFQGEDFKGHSSSPTLNPYEMALNEAAWPEPSNKHLLSELSRFVGARRSPEGGGAPAYIALFGSRARNGASVSSDYDILCLFESGSIHDFYVHEDQGHTLEMEVSVTTRFEIIASNPTQHGPSGALELEKLASAKLLFGRVPRWNEWRNTTLRGAGQKGRVYWLTLVLGLRLRPKDGDDTPKKLSRAVCALLRESTKDSHEDQGAADAAILEEGSLTALGKHVSDALTEQSPAWKEHICSQSPIFDCQTPEVARALAWLAERAHP